MRIPEGSSEEDYEGRRFTAGPYGNLEWHVSIVWRSRRWLFVVGRCPPEWGVQHSWWFRQVSWSV